MSVHIAHDAVVITHDRSFTIFDGESMRPHTLLSLGDTSLRFLRTDPMAANLATPVAAFPLPEALASHMPEFLLCFNVLALFVNGAGLRSRELELHWSTFSYSSSAP